MELGLGLVGGIALTIAVTRGWKWAKRHADRPRVVKLGRFLVWFIAAVLAVVVLALLWLTCLAVASVTAQADWVAKIASLGPLATACVRQWRSSSAGRLLCRSATATAGINGGSGRSGLSITRRPLGWARKAPFAGKWVRTPSPTWGARVG